MHNSPLKIPMAVSTQGLVKRFGADKALVDLQFRVPGGGVYLLAGTNGAGKSTLLRMLLGLQAPTSGEIRVLDLDPRLQGPAVRSQVGYVPETTNWGYSWLRVGQMLDHLRRFYPKWDTAYATRLSQALELRLKHPLGALSKGQTRCVQIMAALAHRPKLLLLDELTDGLDPLFRHRVLTIFAQHLADTDCTAIMSTHLVSEIEGLANHVGVLRKGVLLYQGSTDQLLGQMFRFRLEAPRGWTPPEVLRRRILQEEAGIGRTPAFIIAGQECATAALLKNSGARVEASMRLTLDEAVLALLQSDQGL